MSGCPVVQMSSAAGLQDSSFDVIIVGGGTSGLVVANRLSQNASIRVLEDPDFDWGFRSTPHQQLNGRQRLATSGRTLGGSSAINLVRKFHTGAPPSDSVREFFGGMKSEKKDQGANGPVQVSYGEQYLPYHEDPIKGAGSGPFVTPGLVDPVTHTRSHAAAAYLTPDVLSRPNLRVVAGAQVEKILLDSSPEAVTATHVQFVKDGQSYIVATTREIVLAAGATQTPQLLELSGIGSTSFLRSHGIEPFVDLRGVGENLQDHGIVAFGYEVADGLPSGDMARDPAVAAAAMAAYQKDGSGPLGMVGLVSAFMPCLDFPESERQKLLQKIDELLDKKDLPTRYRKQYNILKGLLKDPNEPTAQYILGPFQLLPRVGPNPKQLFGMGHPGFFISLVSLLSYPLSRGSVHLSSVDYTASPVIDSGILRHPADKIPQTEAMSPLLKAGGERLHTPERLIDLQKAEDLCREPVLSMYHVSGTCAMMPLEDGGAVDPRLSVHGVRNLRVVDASVFPLVPRGNTQATVFVVAEKAADLIKEDHAIDK
ncbi:GMC family oxidoreductase [Aspergillus undulatus]|uniref:GMC family oxidoreductase n=1 Tax=Aspergillus undulatus TaxID=1810928 RepID=UPI003CCD8B36